MTQISVEALKQKTIGEIQELEKGFIFIYQSPVGKGKTSTPTSASSSLDAYAEKLVEGLK